MEYDSNDMRGNPMDLVTVDDFIDSGIRLDLTAGQTYRQIVRCGLRVAPTEFARKWSGRLSLWHLRKHA